MAERVYESHAQSAQQNVFHQHLLGLLFRKHFPNEAPNICIFWIGSDFLKSWSTILFNSSFLNLSLSFCILLHSARKKQAAPSTFCLEISSAKYLSSLLEISTFYTTVGHIKPNFLPLYNKEQISSSFQWHVPQFLWARTGSGLYVRASTNSLYGAIFKDPLSK